MTVPFPDHPPLYETLFFGAVVITGDALTARLDTGETVTY